jgi:hypothetical protein
MGTKQGVIYEGVFYEEGTIEYNNLFLIEGKKEENKGTLLGLISEAIKTEDLTNNN